MSLSKWHHAPLNIRYDAKIHSMLRLKTIRQMWKPVYSFFIFRLNPFKILYYHEHLDLHQLIALAQSQSIFGAIKVVTKDYAKPSRQH